MTTAASIAPSLDVSTLAANLSVLVVAVAAAVAGAWKGWQAIKKTIFDATPAAPPSGTDRLKVISATLTETSTLTMLSESNRDLRLAVCELERDMENHGEEMKQTRFAMQRMTEEMARLVSSLDHNSRTMERTAIK